MSTAVHENKSILHLLTVQSSICKRILTIVGKLEWYIKNIKLPSTTTRNRKG